MFGIVNGRAIFLPKPDYPSEAKDWCSDGKVEVEVVIGPTGDVLSAKAVTGDDLLLSSAVNAAKRARFKPMPYRSIRTRGLVVYNFVSEIKCLKLGVVNDKAIHLPKPSVGHIIHPKHLRLSKTEIVEVQIMIDIWTGEVTHARAISGHPLLRPASVYSARRARFSPTSINSPPIKVRASLVYQYEPGGTIRF